MPRPTYETPEEIKLLLDTRTYPQNFSQRCFELKLWPHEYIMQMLLQDAQASRGNGAQPKAVCTDMMGSYHLGIVRDLRKKYHARYQQYGWPRQGDWSDGTADISPELLFYISIWSSLTAKMKAKHRREAWFVVHVLLGMERHLEA
jgi:hypothetical protein